jgi:hypothetical protein
MLTNGQKLIREADERYRGGPENPLSDDELIEKFTDCTQSMLSQVTREAIIDSVFGLEDLADTRRLVDLVAAT